MKRHFENLADRAGRAVHHWWLLMLAGIFCVALGISVFVFPMESYMVLSILTGIIMLFVGASQLILASTSGNYIAMRGYMVIGGVLDFLLGIFLCAYPGGAAAFLPFMLGIWMMYHAFMTIAFGGDLETFRIKGFGWTIFGGVLLLILSLIILANPFSVGIATIVLMTGIGLILFGFLLCWMSVILRDVDKNIIKDY
ncbi:MAG: DUF308 domain-containing protein [Bacteroidales bacterium]|nr:DUF308 domain-containing protein [Bacteroidales bacterium]